MLKRREHVPLIAGLALALSATSCMLLPDLTLIGVKRAVSLTIAEARRASTGESTEFTFVLTNRGTSAVAACLGPSRMVSYDTTGPIGSSSTWVDHPGCMQEFSLQPGGTYRWSESLDVPHRFAGPTELEVEVEIVNPNRCDGWGCSSTNLTSTKLTIP
jgi:hypothetical protein